MTRFAPRSLLRTGLACLTLLAAPSGATQEAAGDTLLTLLSTKDLVLEPYVVQHVDDNELARTAVELVGRKFFLKENGAGSAPISSVRQLGGTIVLYDTREEVARARAFLERLDVPPPASTYSHTLDYSPRFVTLDVAHQTVADLVDVVYARGRGAIVLSGSEEELAQAAATLARVDVPQKQVLLTCLLLEVGGAGGETAVPAELLTHLKKLLPGPQFSQVGMALLQTSVAAGTKVSVQVESTGKRYRFAFDTAAFDERTSALTVTDCELLEESDSGLRSLFRTSALFRGGEYTVLAGTGATTRLLVVRVTPLE